MKIQYKRDTWHSWMIWTTAAGTHETYVMRMLQENAVSGLLPCRINRLNAEENWYFDISGKQSVADSLEAGPVGSLFLESLLRAVLEAAESCEAYLLPADGLQLSPEVCFGDSGNRFSFVYFPQEERTFRQELTALSETLLPKLDRADERAVMLGYAFYQRCHSEEGPVALLHSLLLMPEKKEAAVPREQEMETAERELLLDAFFAEEKEEESVFVWIAQRFRRLFRRGKEEAEPERLVPTEKAAGKNRVREEYAERRTEEYENPTERRDSPETTLLLPEETRPGDRPVRLVALGKENGPREILLTKERYLVGKKEAGAQIDLEEATVSRLHALLSRREGGYALRDLNSRNGTRVWSGGKKNRADAANGRLLSPQQEVLLKEGDVIAFAGCRFRVDGQI